MKPPRFRYFAPQSLAEAVELLGEHGDDAKVLAGGQSLVPLLNMRLTRPGVLIDLNRIAEMSFLNLLDTEDGQELRIGAMTRQRAVERSGVVAERCPILTEALRHVGHTQIRNRGTIGGSIVHADPSAELPAMLALLGGRVRVQGSGGDREIPYDELFLTYFTTTLMPDEIASEVILPLPPAGAGWSFQEVARRHGDFALAGAACLVEKGEDGRCRQARLSLFGVDGTPVRPESAEALLKDQSLEPDVIEAAAAAVREAVEPEGDIHASADYRRHVAGVLTARTLVEAWQRAERGGDAA